jgi:hypothetical protein
MACRLSNSRHSLLANRSFTRLSSSTPSKTAALSVPTQMRLHVLVPRRVDLHTVFSCPRSPDRPEYHGISPSVGNFARRAIEAKVELFSLPHGMVLISLIVVFVLFRSEQRNQIQTEKVFWECSGNIIFHLFLKRSGKPDSDVFREHSRNRLKLYLNCVLRRVCAR